MALEQLAKMIISPRSYQLELYEHAKDYNSIMVLGTGSGKTFIAILLIKHLADEVRGVLTGLQQGSYRALIEHIQNLAF